MIMNQIKQLSFLVLLLAISLTRMSCVFAALSNSKFDISKDFILSDESESESESESENESENETSIESVQILSNQLNFFMLQKFQGVSSVFSLRSLRQYRGNSYASPILGCFTPPPINK
jgi:hypothetical protein